METKGLCLPREHPIMGAILTFNPNHSCQFRSLCDAKVELQKASAVFASTLVNLDIGLHAEQIIHICAMLIVEMNIRIDISTQYIDSWTCMPKYRVKQLEDTVADALLHVCQKRGTSAAEAVTSIATAVSTISADTPSTMLSESSSRDAATKTVTLGLAHEETYCVSDAATVDSDFSHGVFSITSGPDDGLHMCVTPHTNSTGPSVDSCNPTPDEKDDLSFYLGPGPPNSNPVDSPHAFGMMTVEEMEFNYAYEMNEDGPAFDR